MGQRDISYGELDVLCQLFEEEIAERNITFPHEEIREQALLDFIGQYQNGNDEPHIELCCNVIAEW